MRIQSNDFVQKGRLLSHTDTLEPLLRVIGRIIQLYGETVSLGIKKLHRQLYDTIEILGVIQSIQLFHDLCFQNMKMSWQKKASRISLAIYSCLRNFKWAEKLELIQLGKLNCAIVGKLTGLSLATDCSYIFYRTCVIGEGLRTKTHWRVAVSIGKIFAVIAELAIKAWNIHKFACLSGLIFLHLVLDSIILKQRIYHV